MFAFVDNITLIYQRHKYKKIHSKQTNKKKKKQMKNERKRKPNIRSIILASKKYQKIFDLYSFFFFYTKEIKHIKNKNKNKDEKKIINKM